MKKYIYHTLAIFCITAVLFACQNKKSGNESESVPAEENLVRMTSAQYVSAKLVIGKITNKEMSAVIRVKGKVDVPPQKMLSVSVPMGGYLQSTRLLPGMRVEKGEVIAKVTGEQYIQLQQDYLMAKEKVKLHLLQWLQPPLYPYWHEFRLNRHCKHEFGHRHEVPLRLQ